MKFTGIRIIGLSTIDLPIVGALPSDTYVCKSVDGLGPVGVDVYVARSANGGNLYQGRRPRDRQLTARIGLNPDHSSGQTVSDLRNYFYGLLTPGFGDIVRFQFMDGETQVAYTTGHVSECEPNPFSKDPEIIVKLDCIPTYLEAPAQVDVVGLALDIIGITNAGNAPTGFHMELTFNSNTSSWNLWDAAISKTMAFNYAFLTGDKLVFDTRPGFRKVELVRAGVTTNIIHALADGSPWFMLHGGTNIFFQAGAITWGSVYYTPQYWGV